MGGVHRQSHARSELEKCKKTSEITLEKCKFYMLYTLEKCKKTPEKTLEKCNF